MTPNERFARSLDQVLAYEGGYSDNPHDSGGPTYKGVTLAALIAWRGRPCTATDLQKLSEVEIADFYHSNYWMVVHGDDLPAGLDLMVFDAAVNQGPGTAIRFLQTALGLTPDGQIGPVTQAAIATAGPSALALVDDIQTLRAAYYRGLDSFVTFGAGWLSRLARCWGTARVWATSADPTQEIA